MTKKSQAITYTIFGISLLACIVYLLFDLNVINLKGNNEDETPIVTNETVTTPPEQVIPVEQISFVKNDYSIHIGEVTTLEVIITPTVATTSTITWKSSDTSIAEVDQNGYVIGKKKGIAVITAESDNGIMAKTTVSVTSSSVPIIEINQVTLSKNSTRIKVGESEILQVAISPNDATYKTLIWSSSNSSIVTVNENGKIEAIREGSATITVKSSNGKSDSVSVTVEKNSSPNVDVTSVSLSKNNITLEIGQSSTITASVNPSNATNKTITWKSSNTSIATVDASGKITAVSPGTATITATSNNGKSNLVTVTVTKSTLPVVEVSSITLSKTSVTLEAGQAITVTATVQPSNATNKTINWSSSNTSIATVDASGKITAVSPGTATITATSNNGKSSHVTVTVTKKSSSIEVTSVTLSKTSLSMYTEDNIVITATIAPSNATNKTITWSSSNSNVATVTKSGKITAVGEGTATITAASNNGKKATVVVTVTAPIAASGRINNDYFGITPGENVGKAKAKKNSEGITAALKHASTHGIENVSLDKNTYVVVNIVDDDNNNNAAIQMASNVKLDLNNSVIQLYTNYDPKYSVIYFHNVTNATIKNGKIVGDRATHRCNSSGKLIDSYSVDGNMCGSSHGGTHEWGFGIKIQASSNITVKDLSITYMTGDGVYVRIHGKHTGSYPTKNIKILNNRISKCRRQGISIVSGEDITIQGNEIHDIQGAAPQLGIDLEPSQDFDIIKNVTIVSNKIYKLGNARAIAAAGQTDTIENSITIKDNKLSACICIPKKAVKLSGNTKINNQGNSYSGNWNSNCPY